MNERNINFLKQLMRENILGRLEAIEAWVEKSQYPVEEFFDGPVEFEADFELSERVTDGE